MIRFLITLFALGASVALGFAIWAWEQGDVWTLLGCYSAVAAVSNAALGWVLYDATKEDA